MASDKDRDVVEATDKHDETEPAEKTLPNDATPDVTADERAESPMQKQPSAPPPPPNGGLLAWTQVVGSFFLYFNTWGLINMFGIYQTYYEGGQLFHESSSAISWIGSVQSFLLMFMSVFVGPIYDRGYLRLLLITGSFLIVFGHMMLSLCHEYWEVMLAQGVCIGIGAGMLFIPAVTIGAQYFTTKLGLALGIATAGSSLGGVLYPIALFRLINEVGFPWAVKIVGFITLATLLVSTTLLRLRVKPPKIRALFDWTVFKDPLFMMFVLFDLVAFMGIFVFFFYVSFYAEEQHILGATLSFYIVPIFNSASIFGRALPNALSDKIGPFNVLAPGVFLAGVFMLLEMTVRHSAAGIIVLAVLTGFASGVLIGIPPLCFVALTENKAVLGTRMGMGLSTVAFGILAGGPAAGGIIGTRPPLDWTGAWTFGGVCCCVGALGFLGVRIAKYGWKINQKA